MARQFTRANAQYLLNINNIGLAIRNISFVGLFKRTSNDVGVLFASSQFAGATERAQINSQADGKALSFMQHMAPNGFAISSVGSTINEWASIQANFISFGAGQEVYLNGANKGSNATSIVWPDADDYNSMGCVGTSGARYDYLDGVLAEMAIYCMATSGLPALTQGEVISLAKGYSPLLVRLRDLYMYWPLWGDNSPERELRLGYTMSLQGGAGGPAKARHPRVIYPSFLS